MEEVEVIINEDRITAKEVNPYKDQIDKEERLGYTITFGLIGDFRSKEAALKTFEIKSIRGIHMEEMPLRMQDMMGCGPGTRHMATLLKSGKIKIL